MPRTNSSCPNILIPGANCLTYVVQHQQGQVDPASFLLRAAGLGLSIKIFRVLSLTAQVNPPKKKSGSFALIELRFLQLKIPIRQLPPHNQLQGWLFSGIRLNKNILQPSSISSYSFAVVRRGLLQIAAWEVSRPLSTHTLLFSLRHHRTSSFSHKRSAQETRQDGKLTKPGFSVPSGYKHPPTAFSQPKSSSRSASSCSTAAIPQSKPANELHAFCSCSLRKEAWITSLQLSSKPWLAW
jgi:hypothetical protein